MRGLEVLMIERAKTMKFAPGAFVFPGGKIDASDTVNWRWQGRTSGRGAMRDFPFRVAALRELFEEAGILLLDGHAKHQPLASAPFDRLIERTGRKLDVANLVPFAHWVTPEPMPRRFDTYFYLAAHNGEQAMHDGNEAISFRWVSPRALLDDWENDRIPLMFPTRLNLMKLARSSSVADAFRRARQANVVRTLPVIDRQPGRVHLTIGAETGYGVTMASEKEIAFEAGASAKKP